jgi:hypothetical protein
LVEVEERTKQLDAREKDILEKEADIKLRVERIQNLEKGAELFANAVASFKTT